MISVFSKVDQDVAGSQGHAIVSDRIWLQKVAGTPAAGATLSYFWEDWISR